MQKIIFLEGDGGAENKKTFRKKLPIFGITFKPRTSFLQTPPPDFFRSFDLRTHCHYFPLIGQRFSCIFLHWLIAPIDLKT